MHWYIAIDAMVHRNKAIATLDALLPTGSGDSFARGPNIALNMLKKNKINRNEQITNIQSVFNQEVTGSCCNWLNVQGKHNSVITSHNLLLSALTPFIVLKKVN
ncbi:hypothetical protein GDO86_013732 [Hymenochirus boettgeri]|uniref:Uncharacterized protein n=1 Tax=Hymenochirus boettgeri TaxID=247094 RepID=A0A8T2JLC1_9PIPI|nr:hypothetical protein GDO86_013732 [Hymenochirus boettgeri]